MRDQDADLTASPTRELQQLRREKVRLDQLYLDPNNPRFGVGRNVPDARITESTVQQDAQERIERIGIDDLLSSLRRYGFAPTDPVVVRRLADNNFVVLEGNRRVATLKKLYQAYQRGDSLDLDILQSLTELEVLVYDGTNPDIVWIVQGLRHMSGIKEWPPRQQAAFIAKIEQQIRNRDGRIGRPPGIPTVAKAAGVSNGVAARLLRTHYGFQQAQTDEEYGEQIDDDKFSMFAEAVFRKEALWEWLDWSDELRKFRKIENLRKFLSWITPSEDGVVKIQRANPEARDFLPNVIGNTEILRRFENGSLTIYEANAEVTQKRVEREIDLSGIKERLQGYLGIIDSLPLPRIERENRKAEFLELLTTLRGSIESQIKHLQESS